MPKLASSVRNLPRIRRDVAENVYLSMSPPNMCRVSTYGVGGRHVRGVVISRVHVMDLTGQAWIEFAVLSDKLEVHVFAWKLPYGETETHDG